MIICCFLILPRLSELQFLYLMSCLSLGLVVSSSSNLSLVFTLVCIIIQTCLMSWVGFGSKQGDVPQPWSCAGPVCQDWNQRGKKWVYFSHVHIFQMHFKTCSCWTKWARIGSLWCNGQYRPRCVKWWQSIGLGPWESPGNSLTFAEQFEQDYRWLSTYINVTRRMGCGSVQL